MSESDNMIDSNYYERSQLQGASLSVERYLPITFEDLGIPRSINIRPSLIGNIRTLESFNYKEMCLLFGGILCILLTVGFTLNRFIILSPESVDYSFYLLLIFNSVYSIIYVANGLFKEQTFDVLAFVFTLIFVVFNLAVNFLYADGSNAVQYTYKLAWLIVAIVTDFLVGGLGIAIGIHFWKTGNLIFRTVGADTNNQKMCADIFTTLTLILFDIQLSISFLILTIEDMLNAISIEEIVTLSFGVPFVLIWSMSTYLAVRWESKKLFLISMILSPVHIAFYAYSIAKTAESGITSKGVVCMYVCGSAGLVVHPCLLVFLIFASNNFGKGLKEKVFATTDLRS